MKQLSAVALVALVAVAGMTFADQAQARDRWGFDISPYGVSLYYGTGGRSYSYSSGHHARPYYQRAYHHSYHRPYYSYSSYQRPAYYSYSRPAYTPRPVIVRRTVIRNNYYTRPVQQPTYANGFGGYSQFTYSAKPR